MLCCVTGITAARVANSGIIGWVGIEALDFHNQAIMLSMLRRLSRERGLAIVMITHESTHALEIADQVALLYGNGRCAHIVARYSAIDTQ